ncbi:MAG TPA: hypothetical protein VNS09_01660 [Solirubrobacter sp.]|nr:hypothetical protein [Solirubrobacter sp.]
MIRPLPHPPLVVVSDTGVVDRGFVGVERLIAGSVDVAGAVDRGDVDRGDVERGDVERGDVERGTDDRGDFERGEAERGAEESDPDGAAAPPVRPYTVMTVFPPLPTNVAFDRNSAVHVRASTVPVTVSPYRFWKDATAARVIGPKIPSSSTPTCRCTAATAAPVSPKETSDVEGIETTDRSDEDDADAAAGPRPADASAANGDATGPAAIEALTANAAPLRRVAPRRAASVISRRCRDRANERSQSATSPRSRASNFGYDNS